MMPMTMSRTILAKAKAGSDLDCHMNLFCKEIDCRLVQTSSFFAISRNNVGIKSKSSSKDGWWFCTCTVSGWST